jgi:type IV pilus assembly protein PilN
VRDINFFRPYKSKDKSENQKYYYQIMALSIASIIVCTFSINVCKILVLNKKIENYEAQLNKEEIKEKIKTSEEVNRKLDALTRYEKDLDLTMDSIEKRDIVSNQILDAISSTVPKNVNFKSMNINHEIVNIQAITTNRQAIGEIQHNLKSISCIKDAHIESISGNESVEGEYSFNIKCYLNGGAD